MFVERNAGNTNVIYVTLVEPVGGKKMTVFEKIKEFNKKEMANFLKEVSKQDFFTDYFCGNLCYGYKGCKDDDGICLWEGYDLLEEEAFLGDEYINFEEYLQNG